MVDGWEDEARLDGLLSAGSNVNWSMMRVTENNAMLRQVVVLATQRAAEWMSDGLVAMIGWNGILLGSPGK